jgi:hypothetical protein
MLCREMGVGGLGMSELRNEMKRYESLFICCNYSRVAFLDILHSCHVISCTVQYLCFVFSNMNSNDINGVYVRVNRRNTMVYPAAKHVAHLYLVRIPYHHAIGRYSTLLNNAFYGGLYPS